MRDQMNTVTFNNSRAIKSIKSFKIIEEYFSYRKSFNYALEFPGNMFVVNTLVVATPPSPVFKIDLHKRNKEWS